ncbi:MAG: tetratricopeptide repeat protein [Acidobacteriota bacterium]|nr:tetratricopeptide repeat protein [Acidobacteriota bacterium]
MSARKGSCLKRAVIGCGGMIALFIVVGLLLTLIGFATRPDASSFRDLDESQSVGQVYEPSQMLGDGGPPPKPVRLQLDLNMVQFRLKPHDQSGQIRVESNFDEANFELATEVEEKDDHTLYKVRFKNKRTVLGMLIGAATEDFDPDEVENRLTLYVPRDLLLAINYDISMGDIRLDLSGLAVSELEGKFSMGEFRVEMEEPNQIPMKTLDIRSEMGETRIYDAQNMRYTEGKITGNMGGMRVSHSGPYAEDANLRVKMSMGEVNVQRPPRTNFDQRVMAMMGGVRKVRDAEPNPELPTLTLSGKVTMGEFRTTRNNTSRRETNRLYDRLTSEPDWASAMVDFREMIAQNPARMPDESSINSLGYRLLRADYTDQAVEVFKLNTEWYPQYTNGYDSLGEGYMVAGKYEEAIANYEIVLEREPGNENATRQLRRIRARMESAE